MAWDPSLPLHPLDGRAAELDDMGAVDWASVGPNTMRSDIASGVSVSESRHPNATSVDRHAPSVSTTTAAAFSQPASLPLSARVPCDPAGSLPVRFEKVFWSCVFGVFGPVADVSPFSC